jgi:hypothetical protein
MKFSQAWSRVSAQNVTLKVCTTTLGMVVVAQLFVITNLALRAPLVVERSCVTKTLALSPERHSPDEIKAFLREAISERLDSGTTPHASYFSPEEMAAREREQTAFRDKQMTQRFLPGEITISGNEILVSGDRIIGIGKIKSVLPLALRINLKQVLRTEENPYGLVVAEVSEVKEKGEAK